jgi:hypothetical protein
VSPNGKEHKPPYTYKRVERDDPKGEKFGLVVEHHAVDCNGNRAASFLTEGAARWWIRVINEYKSDENDPPPA